MRAAAALGTILVLAGCSGPAVNCGPLAKAECADQATIIVAAMAEHRPSRTVTAIEFVDEEGHAFLTLDDGSEVAWGERL